MNKTKTCTRCGEEKSLDMFRPHVKRANGSYRLFAKCRECEASDAKNRRLNNPSTYKAAQKKYRDTHKEERREYNNIWREENHEQALVGQRKWREENPEKNKSSYTNYRINNREKYLASKRKARKSPEYQAKIKAHREANKGVFATYARNRRARLSSATGTFTQEEFNNLCSSLNNICLCCGEEKKLTADHVIPISRGGSNSIDNIQPLCQSCNSSKHTQTIDYRVDAI